MRRRALSLGLLTVLVEMSVASGACSSTEGEAPAPPPFEIASGATRVRVELRPFRLAIFDGTREVISTIGEGGTGPIGTPAVSHDEPADIARGLPGWDGYEENVDPWTRGIEPVVVAKDASSAKLRFDVSGGTIELDVTITPDAKVKIAQRAKQRDKSRPWNKSTITFTGKDDTHFFGLGERYATLDHKGWSLYSYSEEAGLGAGEGNVPGPKNPAPNGPSMTYFPVPTHLSNDGYGMWVNTTYRVEHHFQSERKDALRVAVNHTELEIVLYVNQDPLAILDAYTKDTGRPIVPPHWVFGPRRRTGNGSMVEGVEEWKLLRERRVPTTGIDDALHFLPARSEVGKEDAQKTFAETVHANGFKLQGYYNPYVGINKPVPSLDYEYGRDKGFFLKDPIGKPGVTSFISGQLLDVATIDLTNPEAVLWFHSMLKRATSLGYDGWMHDFGEYVGRDWTTHTGRLGTSLHNEYPVLSAKAGHDFWQKERPGDYLFFVRSGWTGTQAYAPAVWGGDPEATFDETQGMPASLKGALGLAFVGVPYWGSDISGFKCFDLAPRDKEVYLRWAELGAVSPIMMDQNACYAVPERKTKWTLWSDAETTKVYGDMARLHTRMQPYFLTLAREANLRGIPLMRHPFLTHPREPAAWKVEDAFFLGPALYASPVVKRGLREKTTWLPPGRKYVDLSDGKVYDGGKDVTVSAPLEKLPLFLVSGEVLPLWDESIETLAPATIDTVVTPAKVADRLDVIVALAKGQEAKLVLLDGTELVAKRVSDDGGNPQNLTTVTADEIAACSACTTSAKVGDVERVRVTSELAATSDLTFRDLRLTAKGPSARRVRWDVYSL